MCGISGIAQIEPDPVLARRLTAMWQSQSHRGPDGHGTYIDNQLAVGLSHARLAIFDPEHGAQPLTSADGRYTIVFNGAIYNYLELRRDLVGFSYPIKTYCDTEILLYAYIHWGPDVLERLNGMFAFCIWDAEAKTGFLARDRIGIKPLYYFAGAGDRCFLFGSEIKSLLASGLVDPQPSTEGLIDYITFQYVLGEKTLFEGVRKLLPGHYLRFEMTPSRVVYRSSKYWTVPEEADPELDYDYCVNHLSELIDDSVSLRLRSDVPVGAHLSGGIDSSAVVAFATSHVDPSTFNTFTGTFTEGPEFSEVRYARIVADAVKANYNEILISGEQLEKKLRDITFHMDEPTAGPGVIPQFRVSEYASKLVKVSLGGQGGDELFVGYARYLIAYLEECLRGAIHDTYDRSQHIASLQTIAHSLSTLKEYVPLLRNFWSKGLFEDPASRYFALVDRGSKSLEYYHADIAALRPGAKDRFTNLFEMQSKKSLINKICEFELKTSLPALLHVEDRSSMAFGLESRVPLLDHRLVEFAFRIPPGIKFKQGEPKHILKQAVRHRVPHEILDRRDKMGFPVPLQHWYQAGARDFVHDVLTSQRAASRGIIRTGEVEQLIASEGTFGRDVWGLLSLELWFQEFIDGGYRDRIANLKSSPAESVTA